MPMITFADKVAVNTNAGIPDINKCNATDLNEIKSAMNGYVMTGWYTGKTGTTYSYVSWNATTKIGVVSTNQDVTSLLSVGMKVKFTQSATTKYGIIVAISSTQISLYMGNNYTLINANITNPYYSMVENPYGFPTDLVNTQNASLKSKIISISRDGQGANGNVSYTGIGFKPTSVKAIMVVEGTLYKSNGFADSTGASGCTYTSSANVEQISDWLITYSNQTGWVQHGKVYSYDTDGLTIQWEKIGTPVAGTMQIYLLCER